MKSEFIKKAYSNSEYTPEQIEELKKCFHDPIYFMKTYVKVMHPKKGVVLSTPSLTRLETRSHMVFETFIVKGKEKDKERSDGCGG